MVTLRLTPRELAGGAQHVTLELQNGDEPPLRGSVRLRFALDSEQRESLRWYLEDFLRCPTPPAEIYAARVQYGLAEWGTTLFRAIFRSKGGRPIWAAIRDRLGDTRVELAVDPGHIEVPWELMCESRKREPVALRTRSFVYVPDEVAHLPTVVPASGGGPVRLLLCIARPKGSADISFRSVAVRLMHSQSSHTNARIRIDLLRPSTFERLQHQLADARSAGEPYSLVHFDGHGVFEDLTARLSAMAPAGRKRGYLVFEDGRGGEEYVDGPAIGSVLVEAGVRVLVLNACRSAHTAQAKPGPAPVDDRARAFGSLAAELTGAGLEGVVAMRYNLYLATAVRLVSTLYRELICGRSLGESVAMARTELARDPRREVGVEAYELADWLVPVVTERRPMTIPVPAPDLEQHTIAASSDAPPARLDPELPGRPIIGFIGQDEPLLELDRALQSHRIVLLHGPIGRGKTAAVAEFARWLYDTGGARGPVLFSSLRQCSSGEQLLDETGERALAAGLAAEGKNWRELSTTQRREVVAQRLGSGLGLWILDDADAPQGDLGHEIPEWSNEARMALATLVRELADAGLRFVLTARRATGAVAGLATAHVPLGPLSMEDRVQFARALVQRAGAPSLEPHEWASLLRICDGNPALLEQLVARVLATGPPIPEAVAAVTAAARARPRTDGEEDVGDDLTRLEPLLAAFHALPEADRHRLDLLHLFHGAADSLLLWWMGYRDNPAALPELANLSLEQVSALLERGVEVDLLESLGGGCYVPHPALAELLATDFTRRYPKEPPAYNRALHAYAEAVSQRALVLDRQAKEDSRDPQLLLRLHADNLRHAREISLAYLGQRAEDPHRESWLGILVGTMQGLHRLYGEDLREWMPLVEATLPAVTADPEGREPKAGAEYAWSIISGYRVRIARELGRLEEALALHRPILEFDRARAAPLFRKPAEQLSQKERQIVADFASSLHERAQLQRQLGDPACVDLYRKSLEISARLGDHPSVSTCAFNLGITYLDLEPIKDLQAAEHWLTVSEDRCPPDDWIGRAMCFAQLGLVERERQHEASHRGDASAASLHLNRAFALATRALQLTPAHAPSFALRHEHLADLCVDAGRLDQAVKAYREAIGAYAGFDDDGRKAASACLKLARVLFASGRHLEARDYASEAVIGYHFAQASAREEEARALFLELDALVRPEAQP